LHVSFIIKPGELPLAARRIAENHAAVSAAGFGFDQNQIKIALRFGLLDFPRRRGGKPGPAHDGVLAGKIGILEFGTNGGEVFAVILAGKLKQQPGEVAGFDGGLIPHFDQNAGRLAIRPEPGAKNAGTGQQNDGDDPFFCLFDGLCRELNLFYARNFR
jgi:hypothetical protein